MWSAATLVAPPATPAVTLDEAKEFVRADGDASDAQLTAFVDVAIEQIEAICSVRLAPQTVELFADRWEDLARLPIGPTTAIVSLHYRDAAGAEQLLDADQYELTGSGLAVGIRPAPGTSWPIARTIRVQLTAGYTVTPRPLWAAALYMIGDLYAFRETAVVGTGAAQIPMSTTVSAMIANYRIWL